MTVEHFYTPEKTKPVLNKLVFEEVEKVVYSIVVENEEYEKCVEASGNMWANEKTGVYGGGMLNTKNDPRRTERIGKLGEMAFSKIFSIPIDLTYRRGGDKQDFLTSDSKKINIKTASEKKSYNCGLVKATNDNGTKLIPLSCDIYVFAYVAYDNRDKNEASVVVIGYMEKEEIEKKTPVPARNKFASHLNYEVPFVELKPIKDLKFA